MWGSSSWPHYVHRPSRCTVCAVVMISVHFQGKPFNITVIQVYASTSNAEEAEVERFYEDLQDLLELMTAAAAAPVPQIPIIAARKNSAILLPFFIFFSPFPGVSRNSEIPFV